MNQLTAGGDLIYKTFYRSFLTKTYAKKSDLGIIWEENTLHNSANLRITSAKNPRQLLRQLKKKSRNDPRRCYENSQKVL